MLATGNHKKPLFLAVVIVVVQILISLFIWQLLVKREQQYVTDIAVEELDYVKILMQQQVDSQTLALSRMANRWGGVDGQNVEAWRADARQYVRDFQPLKAAEIIDTNYRIKWVEPLVGNEMVIGLNVIRNQEWKLKFESAIAEKAVLLSAPFTLAQGYDAVIIYAPSYTDNRFIGFVAGLLSIEELLEKVLHQHHRKKFSLRISYGDAVYGDTNDGDIEASNTFSVAGQTWNIYLKPSQVYIDSATSILPELFLGASVLFAILLGAGFYYLLLSRIQAVSLSDKEALYSTLISESGDGFIIIDDLGVIQNVNSACETIFGYSSEQLVGHKINQLMPEPFQSQHDQYLDNFNKTGDKKIIGIGREVQAKGADGRVFPIDLSVSQIKLHDRALYGGIIRDVSHHKMTEEALVDANREMEELSFRTSNDIRAPIASSIRLIEVAIDAAENDELKTTYKSLSLAKNALKEVEVLIVSILNLMQIKSREEAPVKVDIDQLVEQSMKACQAILHSDNIIIKKEFNYQGALIAKASRIQMIVDHLLSNAIKYQDTRKPESFVTIKTFSEGNYFCLEMIDNGLGIPEDQRHKLFSMFTRFHANIAYGAGLGLYLAKKCAELMHGRLDYESRNGDSVFCLRIPLD